MNNRSDRKSWITAACLVVLFLFSMTGSLVAAPVITPIGNVTVPAGKSLIIPITATVTNGRPLTFTITGITNGIAIVTHTNNPFWKINVAQACAANAPGAFQTPFRGGVATVTNVGDMTFMLFPEYAPNTVSIFQGLSDSGFYNSNTIFHRVINGFIIQGGDPLTNGTGGLVFQYDDEFNPQAIFSGNGQLALANSGKNTDGSQFFVTEAPYRYGDFQYTIFGQLVRGFAVLTNIETTPVDANDRPLANEIITQISMVPDTADTVITLVATNRAGVTNKVTVIANDGAGGYATNIFIATSITDSNSNNQPFFFGNIVTNVVAPVNTPATNIINALELDGEPLYWFLYNDNAAAVTNYLDGGMSNSILKTLTYNVTNAGGQVQFYLKPPANFTGQVAYQWVVSPDGSWDVDGEQTPFYYLTYFFTFGDTPINAQASPTPPKSPGTFTNLLLATFTNGVPGSAVTNFTASIQWGDDTIAAGVIGTNTARMKEVFGSHSYTNSGVYPIAITIQSGLGASAVVSNGVTVMPSLSLTHMGTNMVAAWPAWAYQFGLQSSSNLTGTVWTGMPNYPVLSGFQNVVSNTALPGKLFFRLNE
ncbi:MAG TPA: peptidylprolyl isomerase [Candidatus Sulfopaludibacter sp.]|nr:peptidylprolyl isomerase [Candidatus Sulfopaludibacter sp.]